MKTIAILRNFCLFTVSSVSLSCGDRNYDNPVDTEKTQPIAAGTNQDSPTPENPTGADSPKVTPSGTTVGGKETVTKVACLTDDCTSPAAVAVTPPAFSVLDFFPGNQGGTCSVAKASTVSNGSANRITLIYRANYASMGVWQLYARNISVASNGTMTAGDPVNLFPNCFGNSTGITDYSITGYASSTLTSQNRALNNLSDGNFTHVKISSTCFNTGLNETKSFNLTDLSDDTTTTMTNYLSASGALGYWPEKNVYIKADGTTLNPDGTTGTTTIPGNWTSSGTSPLGAMSFLGTDSQALYVVQANSLNSIYAVSANLISNAITAAGSNYTAFGRHPTFGMFAFYSGAYVMRLYTTGNFSQSPDINARAIPFASRIIGTNGYVLSGSFYHSSFLCEVLKYNFSNGTAASLFKSSYTCKTSLGTIGNRSLLSDVTSSTATTGKLFLTPDLSAL